MASWSSLRPSASPTWLVLAAGTGFVMASFDVMWFVRLAMTRISSLTRNKLSPEKDEGVVYGIVATTDIDYFCHMNNGRYLREMDFGRFDFYFRSGLSAYFDKHPKVYVVQHASMIRYRRSLDFLMPFRLHTKLVWFDERSLYFEQKFVSVRDDFVRAIAYCKNTAVHCDVLKMMCELGVTRPECPKHLEAFIDSNELSSRSLRDEEKNNTLDVAVIPSKPSECNLYQSY